MTKFVFRIAVAVLLTTMVVLVGVIGKQNPKTQVAPAVLVQPAVPVQTAPAKPIEYPAPTQPATCPVAVFGTNGCKELQRLQGDIEDVRPCAEMSKRGMQAQADRCFKETRELQRDIRDRNR